MANILLTIIEIILSELASVVPGIINEKITENDLENCDKRLHDDMVKSLDACCYEAVDLFISQSQWWGEQVNFKTPTISKVERDFYVLSFFNMNTQLLPYKSMITPLIYKIIDTLERCFLEQLSASDRILYNSMNRHTHAIISSQMNFWKRQELMLSNVSKEVKKIQQVPVVDMVERNKTRFFFEKQWIPLIGRDKEFEKLKDFLHCCQSSWWAITGDGGSGKSRLAWELANIAQLEHYNIVINSFTEQLHEYEVVDRTLFIFDYASECISTISGILNKLLPLSEKLDVKILFIERNGNTIYNSYWIKLLSSKIRKFDYFLNLQYNGQGGDFICLGQMNNTDLGSIIKQYLYNINIEANNEIVNQLIRKLHNNGTTDAKCLPIFGLIIAYGWAKFKDDPWNVNDSFQSLFLREVERIDRTFNEMNISGNRNAVCKILCIATVQKQVLIGEGDQKRFLPELCEVEAFLKDQYSIPGFFRLLGVNAEGNSDHHFSIKGIFPDIIGENFVYRCYLSDNENLDKCLGFIDAVWESPKQAVQFFVKLFQDFKLKILKDDALLPCICNLEDSYYSEISARKYYCMLLLKIVEIFDYKIQDAFPVKSGSVYKKFSDVQYACIVKIESIYKKYCENEVAWRYALILRKYARHQGICKQVDICSQISRIYLENKSFECLRIYWQTLEELRDILDGDDKRTIVLKMNEIKHDFLLFTIPLDESLTLSQSYLTV